MCLFKENIARDILNVIKTGGFIYDLSLDHTTITFYLEEMNERNFIAIPSNNLIRRDQNNRIPTEGIIISEMGRSFLNANIN